MIAVTKFEAVSTESVRRERAACGFIFVLIVRWMTRRSTTASMVWIL